MRVMNNIGNYLLLNLRGPNMTCKSYITLMRIVEKMKAWLATGE